MKIIKIENCSTCPYRDHTGNIGSKAKPMCGHPNITRLGTDGGLSRLTIRKYPEQPKWCPLEEA